MTVLYCCKQPMQRVHRSPTDWAGWCCSKCYWFVDSHRGNTMATKEFYLRKKITLENNLAEMGDTELSREMKVFIDRIDTDTDRAIEHAYEAGSTALFRFNRIIQIKTKEANNENRKTKPQTITEENLEGAGELQRHDHHDT